MDYPPFIISWAGDGMRWIERRQGGRMNAHVQKNDRSMEKNLKEKVAPAAVGGAKRWVPRWWWRCAKAGKAEEEEDGRRRGRATASGRRNRRRWRMGSGSEGGGSTRALGEKIGNGDLEGVINGDVYPRPEHLVILVNGIIGSANDWTFAASRFRERLGRHVAIHCSEASASLRTFDGVDVMGKRLAIEVREVIDKTPGVTKISFVAHSLGGLITRYAVSQLYCPPMHNHYGEGTMDPLINSKITTEAAQSQFTIGGLQPENFITLATPHLGCRGTDQLPFLLGIEAFEKTATCCAHWFVGQTGKHLFLTDGSDSQPPLLRRMIADCKEGQFISSLRVFKKRVAYANVGKDQMVGWRTSSIRRQSELPKISSEPIDPSYPHIVREEDPPAVEDLSVVDERRSLADSGKYAKVEEEIVTGLRQIPWYRVDVSFLGTKGGYQAHNLIQVKNPKQHSEGRDVIEHVIDKYFGGTELGGTM